MGFIGDIVEDVVDFGGDIIGGIGDVIAPVAGVVGSVMGQPWIGPALGAASGIYSASQAGDAAQAQTDAINQASGTEWDMYRVSRADQMPWLAAGQQALGDLQTTMAEGPGVFEDSPYYQQGLEEQETAIDRYNASRGLYNSGSGALDLQRNALSNMAGNRGNWVNEWLSTKLNPQQSLAGVGQSTGAGMASNALATGRSVGANQIQAGQSRASGYANQANALTSGIQSGLNAYGLYKGYQQPQTPAYSGAVGGGYGGTNYTIVNGQPVYN